MQFRPIPAAPMLQPYIRNYWLLSFRALPPVGQQRVMTNGASCMMYFASRGEVILYGPSMHNFCCTFEPGEQVIAGVEFHPAGIHAFFKESTLEFANHQLRLSEMGGDYADFEQQLSHMQNIDLFAQIADDFFIERLRSIGRATEINMQRMMKVFAYIETHHPAIIRLGDLAAEANVCPRQFNRIFTGYVGLTPKEYLRIYRFHAALLSLREHPEHTTLMQLAWDNGYYDLKHMNNDFKDICTHAPKSEEMQRVTETFGQQFSLLMKKKILPINVE